MRTPQSPKGAKAETLQELRLYHLAERQSHPPQTGAADPRTRHQGFHWGTGVRAGAMWNTGSPSKMRVWQASTGLLPRGNSADAEKNLFAGG